MGVGQFCRSAGLELRGEAIGRCRSGGRSILRKRISGSLRACVSALPLVLPIGAAGAGQHAECIISQGQLTINTFEGFGFFNNSAIAVDLNAGTISYEDMNFEGDTLIMQVGNIRQHNLIGWAVGQMIKVDLYDQTQNSPTISLELLISTLDNRHIFSLGLFDPSGIYTVQVGAATQQGIETTIVACNGDLGSAFSPGTILRSR